MASSQKVEVTIGLSCFRSKVRYLSEMSIGGANKCIAGVAIMALGALAANPDCGLKIIPCGMNYFHAHKFRSRAVIEFGTPVEVPPELIDLYKKGERREAVSQLLEMIYQALVTVTVTTPDYDTLMVRTLNECILLNANTWIAHPGRTSPIQPQREEASSSYDRGA